MYRLKIVDENPASTRVIYVIETIIPITILVDEEKNCMTRLRIMRVFQTMAKKCGNLQQLTGFFLRSIQYSKSHFLYLYLMISSACDENWLAEFGWPH